MTPDAATPTAGALASHPVCFRQIARRRGSHVVRDHSHGDAGPEAQGLSRAQIATLAQAKVCQFQPPALDFAAPRDRMRQTEIGGLKRAAAK